MVRASPTDHPPPEPGVAPPAKPDLYVVARFLDRLCRADVVYTKSRLQAAVRLNYDIFRSYLVLLEDRGFITIQEQGKRTIVRITARGLEADRELSAWLRRMLGG